MANEASGIQNRLLVHQYLMDHKIIYIPAQPVFAVRMLRAFQNMVYKRLKPGDQWSDLIDLILTYINTRAHSTSTYTPIAARKPEHELYVLSIFNQQENTTDNRTTSHI